jgi:hypothetical protein
MSAAKPDRALSSTPSSQPFRNRIVLRQLLVIPVLIIVATTASAQPKVSGGSTAPAGGQAAQDQAAAEKSRREAAKKALDALKGPQKDKPGQGDDRNKPGGR